MSTNTFNPRDHMPKPVIITTVPGIAVFPKLNEPDTKFNPEGDYKVTLRLDAEEGAKLLAKLEELRNEASHALQAAAMGAGQKATVKKMQKEADLPVREEVDDEGNETGNLLFNFKMRASGKRKNGKVYEQAPVIVDAKNKPLSEDVWGGSKIEVNAAITPFYVPALGTGVALKLRGVRVLDLVTGGGNRDPEAMFGAAVDGYEGGEEKSDGGAKADTADDDDDL